MYITGGSVFTGMVTMGYNIIYSFSDMFAPDTNISLNIATTTSINLFHILYRYIFYFVIVCMAVGGLILLKNLITNNKNKITIPILKKFHIFRDIKFSERKNTLYEMLAFSNYSLLGLYLVVPLIDYQLGFDRVFHITTLLLAPYFIIGFKSILGVLNKLKNFLFKLKNKKISNGKTRAIALSVIFLFNSGIVFEITHDPFPNSIPLSLKNINDPMKIDPTEGNIYLKFTY
jgi:uncharacterized membrane protein